MKRYSLGERLYCILLHDLGRLFRTSLVLVLFSLNTHNIHAQEFPLKIERFSVESGRPTSPVAGPIVQDSIGFIWFGSWNGLYRFDGYTFARYDHDPEDSLSISHDWCQPYIDNDGDFWVGTVAGLDKFNPDEGIFKHFLHDNNDPSGIGPGAVRALLKDSHGYLWIGREEGLDRFDPETETFEHFNHDPEDSVSLYGNQVRVIYEDRDGNIWVGTGNPFSDNLLGGLNLFDPQTNSFRHFLINAESPENPQNQVQAIYQHPDGNLWVAAWQGGLYSFEPDESRFHPLPYLNYPLDKARADFHGITMICEEPGTEFLWMSTFGGGISRYNYKTLESEYYVFQRDDPFSIRENRVWSVYVDRMNNLWIGTHAGINMANLPGRFPRFELTLEADEGVTDIYEADSGILWFGTSKMRLIRWDCENNIISTHQPPAGECTGWDIPGLALTGDGEGNIWVVTSCGFFNYDPLKDRFTRIQHKVNREIDFYTDHPLRLLSDSRGLLWFSSQPLMALNMEDGTVHQYFHSEDDITSLNDDDVDAIFEDREGNLWVGTANGLAKFNRNTGSFTRILNIETWQKAAVTDIVQGEDGFLYLSTDIHGMVRLDPESGKYKIFSIENGIHTNSLFNLLPDDNGYYWLFAPSGISRFNLERNATVFFDEHDGLVEMTFGNRAVFRTGKGDFVIGGFGAVNVFSPAAWAANRKPPNLVLTGLHIDNKQMSAGGNSFLQESILKSGGIRLTHDRNNIAFEFVAINYRNTNRNQYRYKLENYDKEWIEAGSNRTARYAKLPPGKYTFRVKAANDEGIWTSGGISLNLTILKPWWKTNWAYLGYAFFILFFLYGVRKYETRRIHLRNQLQLEKVQAERFKEMDRIKSQFFTNVSHEFRTPLTVISGHLEEAINTTENAPRGLKDAHKYSRRLVKLVNEILDLSRLESGDYGLEKIKQEIMPFLRSQFYSFESYASQRNIKTVFKSDVQRAEGWFDLDKMEVIISNLMSNAIKYSPAGGKVIMSVTGEGDDTLVIRIRDEGPGIPLDEQEKIFDRFYRAEANQSNAVEGTGIGLSLSKELVLLHHGTISVESEPEKGATFSIRFKDVQVEVGPVTIHEETVQEKSGSETYIEMQENMQEGLPIILLVEDNEDVRFYLKQCLEAMYQIAEARNGREGLEQADRLIPDLIIADVMMPEMDGFTLASRLKESEKTSHVPVIMLTAKATEEDKLKGLSAGVDDFLTKPFHKKELLVRIDNLMTIRKRLREKYSGRRVIKPTELEVTGVDQEFMNKVISYIESNISEFSLSVETLAGAVNMSESQLNRKLNSLIGQSPGKLIRSMRLQRGAELIKKNAGTISEIAWDCGFNDLTSFTRSFKREFGVAPTQFPQDSE